MFYPRTQRRGRRNCPHRHRIRTGLFEQKSPLRGKRNFQGRDKEAETALEIQGRRYRDKISLGNSANSGLIAWFREISARTRMRGGPERTRTPGTQFYRTSLCHCPNVASAGASRRRKSSLRRCEPNQDRWRCTVRLDPAIKHRRTAQRHCREKAGNPLRLERLVLSSVSGRQGRSEILPRRLDRRGGASVVRRPPRTERRRSYRVATWWRYRLEYRKRQIGLVHNLTQYQYVIGAPEEIRTPDPQIRSQAVDLGL
jgi:hypothetical protein